MITRNQDVVAMGPNVDCSWVFEAWLEDPTVREAADRPEYLLEQLFSLCEGFVCPTKIQTAVYCLEPTAHFDPDFRHQDPEHVEVLDEGCITFDAWQAAMNTFECEGTTIPLDAATFFKQSPVKMFVAGEDRWIDRGSEFLVKWKRRDDERRPASDLPLEMNLWNDPLDITFSQGVFGDTDEYYHEITIKTDSYMWAADTEAGRINRNRLLELLEGLAALECITDGHMSSENASLYGIVEHTDYFQSV